MRSSLQVLIIVSVLVTLLLPAVVFADGGGPFYTSTAGRANGNGSATDPRLAANASELNSACEYFGGQLGAGETTTLYWILSVGSNSVYYTYNLAANGKCTLTGTLQSGDPPRIGVTLTPPVIVGGLTALGFLLVGAAWLLRRRGLRSA